MTKLGLNVTNATSSRLVLCNGSLYGRNCRPAHSDAGSNKFVCYNLSHRTLIKVQGHDSGHFLQGLITNDMDLLTEGNKTGMYTHMLNVQGRTLYDVIMYRLEEEREGETRLLLECDSSMQESIQRHLKIFKIRKKVTISPCADLSVVAVLPQSRVGGEGDEWPELMDPEKALVWEVDPRTKAMGWRLVTDRKVDPLELIIDAQRGEIEHYHRHRYTIGLPEGVKDLPPGVALPLESNLVYMQGISFSKGCYLGQELTARTHHTGVVRKRLMPVRLSPPAQVPLEGAELSTLSGKPAGKHRADMGELGLSLVRLAHAGEPMVLKPSEDTTLTVKAYTPDWWPKDPKAK